MTLKKIKIDELLYKELSERKKEHESISDVIARILHVPKGAQDIEKLFGLWKKIPEEFFKIMEIDRDELRKEFNKRITA